MDQRILQIIQKHPELKSEFEEIYPELNENEDERVRKEIIRIVDIWTNSSPVVNGIPRETLLTWLKKQKEQKQKITVKVPKFRVGDIIQHVPLERWDSSKKIKAIDKDGYYIDKNGSLENWPDEFCYYTDILMKLI